MSNWAEDPQLYLYTKGNDVYLWRCNQTKDSVPMKIEDFDDLVKVTNHLDLVGGNTSIINWGRDNYIKLVKYISSMHLLVNSYGLVIVEVNKYTQNGKIDDNQSPVYLRSLDVLDLQRFNLRVRPIPPRTVQYLEGDDTRAVPVVELTNVQQELSNAGSTNEVETGLVLDWMNGFTDTNWVGIEDLNYLGCKYNRPLVVSVTGPRGTCIVDENMSNVRADYLYRVNLNGGRYYKAVAIEELNLGKEKARFSKEHWFWTTSGSGITYVMSLLSLRP